MKDLITLSKKGKKFAEQLILYTAFRIHHDCPHCGIEGGIENGWFKIPYYKKGTDVFCRNCNEFVVSLDDIMQYMTDHKNEFKPENDE